MRRELLKKKIDSYSCQVDTYTYMFYVYIYVPVYYISGLSSLDVSFFGYFTSLFNEGLF